jgi:solute:Na+ symporter, SSS family
MNLHPIDIAIIVAYLCVSVGVGFWVSKRASRNMKSYFLGGNTLPWYILGVSNASGMFDIAGTMWLVYLLFIYGMKSMWIPWLWPVFNQIFLMVYLSAWLRRSNVMTGAEWITTRFGTGKGSRLSHIIVVVFALVSVTGFLTYAFTAIGKFAAAFLPWHNISPNQYALILMGVTTFYVVKGGMFSVVVTEVLQFCILSVSAIAIGIIAISKVSPAALAKVVPAGWGEISFGWALNLDWSHIMASAQAQIAKDGYGIFGAFFMMMVFKGILLSTAGPAPNYDMQRILSTKTPREASMMSAVVNVVLNVPRYFMIAGLTVLALVFMGDTIRGLPKMDFELVLPEALARFVPAGLLGVVIAGLLAAFMSNFAATVNAAPPYLVNDLYKRYINPNASDKTYMRLSYAASFGVVVLGVSFGWYVKSIDQVIQWIVNALWGGYAASNVLKWYWWRFNGYGYFWGMVTGIGAAIVVPQVLPSLSALNGFPIILAISLIGCLTATLSTPPESDAVLKDFYKRVRPWGFWGPIKDKVLLEDPTFKPNPDFYRDMINVVVGVAWQTSLVAFPVYIVIRQMNKAWIALTVIAITSVILKFNWYDRLESREVTHREANTVPVVS